MQHRCAVCGGRPVGFCPCPLHGDATDKTVSTSQLLIWPQTPIKAVQFACYFIVGHSDDHLSFCDNLLKTGVTF